MKRIVALGFTALMLAGCAGGPVWNETVFPQQPEYGMAPGTPIVADAKK